MIPFICPTCGQFDIDTPDCLSCVSPSRDIAAMDTLGAAVA